MEIRIATPVLIVYATFDFPSILSSKPNSSWPSFFVRPDGIISGKLENNKPGVLISTVDTSADFYDASAAWRDRAIDSIYHSGTLPKDERSDCRTELYY